MKVVYQTNRCLQEKIMHKNTLYALVTFGTHSNFQYGILLFVQRDLQSKQ